MAVEVKINLTPKQAGKLYMEHIAIQDKMKVIRQEIETILTEAVTISTKRYDWLDEKGRYYKLGKMGG